MTTKFEIGQKIKLTKKATVVVGNETNPVIEKTISSVTENSITSFVTFLGSETKYVFNCGGFTQCKKNGGIGTFYKII